MQATASKIHVLDDPEAGSALALFLAAAGYDVETDIVEGTVFILADPIDPEVSLRDDMAMSLAHQLRARLDDIPEETELAELSSEFRSAFWAA